MHLYLLLALSRLILLFVINWIDRHLYLAFLHHRDYFSRPDSSLSCFSVPQGLFQPTKFIFISLFCSTGIISPRSDASLSCFSVPQGLFQPPGFISILPFCSTGIISTGKMHPCLPLLFRRDYFASVRYVPHRWNHLYQAIPSTSDLNNSPHI